MVNRYSIRDRDYWELTACKWRWFLCFKAVLQWDNTWFVSPHKNSVVIYTPWIFCTGAYVKN